MVICLSPGGQTTTVGESPRGTLLVGTGEGIFSCERRHGSWSPQERLLPGEHISSLLYLSRSRTLFAGTYGEALYASKDLGRNWERRDQGIGNREIYTLAVREVGGRPSPHAGTQPANLFYSDDLVRAGASFPVWARGRRWGRGPFLAP